MKKGKKKFWFKMKLQLVPNVMKTLINTRVSSWVFPPHQLVVIPTTGLHWALLALGHTLRASVCSCVYPHHNIVMKESCLPLFRWENWGSRRLITYARTHISRNWFKVQNINHYATLPLLKLPWEDDVVGHMKYKVICCNYHYYLHCWSFASRSKSNVE